MVWAAFKPPPKKTIRTICKRAEHSALFFCAAFKLQIKQNAQEAIASARLLFLQSKEDFVLLALTSFETRVSFVDDVNTTLAANHAVITVTRGKCFQ